MKILSMTQPWASLVGIKKIETRGWQTSYRRPLAIQAATVFPAWARQYAVYDREFVEALSSLGFDSYTALPRGKIVAVCNLVQVLPTDKCRELGPEWYNSTEARLGDFSPGRWGFILADIVRLQEPIPCKGALKLLAEVEEGLTATLYHMLWEKEQERKAV